MFAAKGILRRRVARRPPLQLCRLRPDARLFVRCYASMFFVVRIASRGRVGTPSIAALAQDDIHMLLLVLGSAAGLVFLICRSDGLPCTRAAAEFGALVDVHSNDLKAIRAKAARHQTGRGLAKTCLDPMCREAGL